MSEVIGFLVSDVAQKLARPAWWDEAALAGFTLHPLERPHSITRFDTSDAVVFVVPTDDRRFDAVINSITPEAVPPPSWLLQVRRNAAAREEFLAEVGALTADDVAELAGSTAKNKRATAHRWLSDKRIFGVEHRSRLIYPGFQFDQSTGAPVPVIQQVLGSLPSGLVEGGWQLALWWTNPSPWLDGDRPLDRLSDSEGLIGAATAEADDWAAANPALVV